MGCVFSAVCTANGKIGVFVSKHSYTRAYSWQLSLLQRDQSPLKSMQADFNRFGSARFDWRCHEEGVAEDDLEDLLIEYGVEHFQTYRPERGYNEALAAHAPPDPEPLPIAPSQMTPAERAHRVEMEGMRSEISELKAMLRAALGKEEKVEEAVPAPVPQPVEPPDTFQVPVELDPDPTPSPRKNAKPVLRLEAAGKNDKGEQAYSVTGEFPSISSAARDCRGTAPEIRKAIKAGTVYKGCRWVFKDAEAHAA